MIYVLFYLISNLLVGYKIMQDNKNATKDWYTKEYIKYKFKGKIIDFVKRDDNKYWLIFTTDTVNGIMQDGSDSSSFELIVRGKDTEVFNNKIIGKRISKDSSSKLVRIYDDSVNYKELELPFHFLFSQ